jgi:hypothetical protein
MPFIDEDRRLRIVKLDFPVVFDGEPLENIVVRRLTAGEVSDFVKEIEERNKVDPKRTAYYPMFYTETGVRIPDEVIRGLDDDDNEVLQETAFNFLPRRFRENVSDTPASATGTSSGTAPATGGATEPTSKG